jgi:type IV pilus assembly protein PilQ
MNYPNKLVASLLLLGALAPLATAGAAEADRIREISVAERDGGLELVIQGDRPPSYSVFKLQDPQRLVIDMAGADVSAVASPTPVGKAGVVSVSTAQYKDERSAVGRVIVTLDGPRKYEVAPRGEAVVVRILGDELASAAAPQQPAAAPAPAAQPAPAPQSQAAAEPPAPQAEPAAAPGADDHVVARRVDEASTSRAARAVLSAKRTADGVLIATDGGLPRIEVTELRDPPRLALDLQGVTQAPRSTAALGGAFSQARFGRADGKVRVVLDAADGLPAYQLKRVKGGVMVVDGAVAAAPAAPAAAPAPAPAAPARREEVAAAPAPARREEAAPAAAPAEPTPAAPARISAVRFSGDARSSRVEIAGKVPYTVTRPDARTVVLTLDGAQLPKALERSLDTTAFKGPVEMLSSFNQQGAGRVRVVATLRGPTADRVVETAGGLAWSFSEQPDAAPEAAPRVEASDAEAAGFAGEAPSFAASGAPQARQYTGRRITLDFHDIEIRNLLRLIADVSKKNIVVADDVSGKVTVSLRNVPWDQALELVLLSKGLGKEEMGNVIRIARLEAIAKEQQAKADAEKARRPLIPLKVRIIPVNFARASEVAARLKDVLTERGTVSTDDRTNVLIVKDIPEALVRAEGLVRNLDTEIPQVLIESRIVEASNNYNRALGVQWGGKATMNQANGNPTGLIFPNSIGIGGAAGSDPNTGTSGSPGYAVNLPAAIGQGSGGGVGFTFGSIGGAFNLNLRLSALENSGVIKTISAPRIATIDNREATIGQGISIPFSQTSASGVNTTFIEAKLELKVTPHVSADGSVLLKIKATNNAPNPQLTGANGQPSISKREAETEVLVKDGDTTVIGGIYTRQTSQQTAAVPWLSKIPVLGFFFKSTTNQDDHTELLIFITPRILNRPANTVAGGNQ